VAGSSESGNKLSGSMKYGEFPDKLRNYQLFKKDSALWRYCIAKFAMGDWSVLSRSFLTSASDGNEG